MTYGIGICLGFRAWNFVVEAELCSGGVHPRLTGRGSTGGTTCGRVQDPPLWFGRIDVYWRRMLLGFVPSRSYFQAIDREPHMPCLDKLIKVRILC
jgi:hypothetical protein